MNKFRFSYEILLLVLVALFLLYMGGCTFKEPVQPELAKPLKVEIYAGPAEGQVVPNGVFLTFQWKAYGGVGQYTYTYQLSGVDTSPVTTTEMQATYRDLFTAGSYTFRVTVSDGKGATAEASRNFSVGANTPPEVTISGPRVNPKYAPGADVSFSWTATDPDLFGQVVVYRWAKTKADADAGNYTQWAGGTVAVFTAPTTVGSYKFYLQAKDNAGGVTSATFDYEVKEPTILIIDNKSSETLLDEMAYDRFYETAFEGFAYAEWDVDDKGGVPTYTDMAPYNVVVWYGSDGGEWWYDVGAPYGDTGECELSKYLDAGGKLWTIGEDILDHVWYTSNPPQPTDFEAKYLHVSTDSAWVGNQEFNMALTTTGDIEHFPSLAVDIAVIPSSYYSGVDAIWPGEGAEIIYSGVDLSGHSIGNIALRYPAGDTGTVIVFQTFPLYGTSAEGARTLAQHLVGTGMGE